MAAPSSDPSAAPKLPARVAIAGASGLLGRALTASLSRQGVRVSRLVRHVAGGPDEITWDPAAHRLDPAALEGIDAVVNLSGENVGAGRWTARRRKAILQSRLDATRTLAEAIGELRRRPSVLVNASAVGFYGDRGDESVAEGAPRGGGFLADVCAAWEAEALTMGRLGVRVTCLRFGVVLAADGGALPKLLPVFRLGLGGRVGSGRQWMSWIALADAIGAIEHALVTPSCVGAVNAVAPQAITNAGFTATLGRVLRRPTLLPVPAWVLRVVFGEMADGTLLASTRAVPERLRTSGFSFRFPLLEDALRHVLRRPAAAG